MTTALKFRREIIDPDPPGSEHDITLIGDINGDGVQDIVIGGKVGEEGNLFWYQGPNWERHIIDASPPLEAGGVLVDVGGAGRLDIDAGSPYKGYELYWFENPLDPTQRWRRRLIEDRFRQYHDQAIGDVDGDGKPEILVSSQGSGIIAYYDIPDDPRVEPWPRECCHVIAEDMPAIEGLMAIDIDGDGQVEILAGPNIFKPGDDPNGPWRKQVIAEGYVKTRLDVADFTGDGALDIILCEGENDLGRLTLLTGPDWEPKQFRDDLFNPHSLEVADFNGDGLPDIFVAEMGLGKNPNPPRGYIYLNKGGGEFEEHLIWEGIPTHEAKVADLNGNGKPDIVGKPYMPERHIDIWWNEA